MQAELVSATGAALLSALVEAYGPIPRMVVETVGYGAGPRRVPSPNALRVLIGEGRGGGAGTRGWGRRRAGLLLNRTWIGPSCENAVTTVEG